MPQLAPCSPHLGEPTVLGLPEEDHESQLPSPAVMSGARRSAASASQSWDLGAPITSAVASRTFLLLRSLGASAALRCPDVAARRLSSNLDPAMRRGTRLDIALSGFGRHWKASSGGDHQLSERVDDYDAFLSHDWHTHRWLKVATLLFVFNSRAASFVGFGASIITALFENWLREGDCSRHLSVGIKEVCSAGCVWSYPVSVAMWVVVFCFWQRFRSAILRKPNMIFFDKLCIEQNDEVKKQEGILHLAGFLRYSKRLVVLWSPRYFSRLWCTFELAAWKYLGGKPPHVLPVNLAVVLLHYMVAWFLAVLPALFMAGSVMSVAIWFSLLLLQLIPFVVVAEQMVSDLRDLPAQLSEFSIRSSKCFCCTNGHVCPETGKLLPCDRSLVYRTLQSWDQVSDAEDGSRSYSVELRPSLTLEEVEERTSVHLDLFDEHVKTDLSEQFTKAIRGSMRLYRLCVRSAGMVYWCFACTNFLGNLLKLDSLHGLRLVLEPLQVTFLVIPTGFVLGVKMAGFGGRCGCIPRFLKIFLQSLSCCIIYAVLWVPVYWTRRVETWIPQVVFMFFLLIVTICAFAPHRGVHLGR